MKTKTFLIALLQLIVCLILFLYCEPIAAEERCNLYLDITYGSNIFSNTYDADIYLDDSFVGTVNQGKIFTFLTETNTGEHSVIFYKSGDKTVSGHNTFKITGDSTANFTIQAHSEDIEIKKLSITDSITGAYMNMPEVTLLDLKTAKTLLEKEGFINVIEEAFDNSSIWNDDKWTVISQNIPANTTIDKNDKIILICKPTDAFLDEHFLGVSVGEALVISDELGYTPEFINEITEKVMKQNIVYMDPKEQSLWIVKKTKMEDSKSRKIALTAYYDGEVLVPIVTDLSLEQAMTELQTRNFSNIKFDANDGSWIANKDKWKVIYQSEPAGKFIRATEEISLICISYSAEKTATANGEIITYSTSTPVPTKMPTATPTIIPTKTPAPTATEEVYVLPGLREYAEKAIVVAFTNMDSLDVFTEDRNYYDPSKFHDYSYVGEYRYTVTDKGIWTVISENSYHVENMYLLMKSWEHAIKLKTDITFENHQYILSHVEYISASPRYIDTEDPSKTSGWSSMEPSDFNLFLTVPSALVGGEPNASSELTCTSSPDLTIDTSGEQTVFSSTEIQKGENGVIHNSGDVGMVMYSKPSFLSDIMLTLINGTSVTVISEPKESEGYSWIQVRTTEGYVGWVFENGVIESSGDLTAPVVKSETQTDSKTVMDTSGEQTVSAAVGFQGKRTVVINNSAGYGMFLYSNPSFYSGVIMETLMNGTPVSIISDPKIVEGVRWFMVRTDDGHEGWVFESGICDPDDYHPVSAAGNDGQTSFRGTLGVVNDSSNEYRGNSDYNGYSGYRGTSNNSGYTGYSSNSYNGATSDYVNSYGYSGSNYSDNSDYSYDNGSSNSVMVWIYPTGKKYHSHQGCGSSGNDWQVTLEEALRRGLDACGRCY